MQCAFQVICVYFTCMLPYMHTLDNWYHNYYPARIFQGSCSRFCLSSSVSLSVISTKNTTLEDPGIWETLKPINVSELTKIMTARSFETLGNVHESCKSCISIGHSYQPHPLSMPCSLLCACPNCWPSAVTHKVQRRQHGHLRAGYVLSRAIVSIGYGL